MRFDKFPRTIAAFLLVLSLLIAACGPAPAAPVQEAAPPAAEQVAEQPAPAETEAPAAEPTAETMPAEEEMAFDPVAAMDEFLASIPEGYWAIGTVEKLQEMMDSTDVLLVDVREPAEVEGGVLPGAIHIPLRQLVNNLDKIPTDRPVVTYCASGFRAALAMTTLEFLGYDNVRAFPPSFKGWTAAEMPVDPQPATPETFPVPELDPGKVAMAQEFLTNIPEGFYIVGTVDKLKEMIDAVNPVLVDVREEKEVAENGKIPGAINIPIRTLASNLDQIPADQPVVTYCASGYRAAMSLAALQMVGYDNVRAFPPSFKGWAAAGEPVEK
jgi:rhodanese-related sulfurtransferase